MPIFDEATWLLYGKRARARKSVATASQGMRLHLQTPFACRCLHTA